MGWFDSNDSKVERLKEHNEKRDPYAGSGSKKATSQTKKDLAANLAAKPDNKTNKTIKETKKGLFGLFSD